MHRIDIPITYETNMVDHESLLKMADGSTFTIHNPYFATDWQTARYTPPEGSLFSSILLGKQTPELNTNENVRLPRLQAQFRFNPDADQTLQTEPLHFLTDLINLAIPPFAGIKHTDQPSNQFKLMSIGTSSDARLSEISFIYVRPNVLDPSDPSINQLTISHDKTGIYMLHLGNQTIDTLSHKIRQVFASTMQYLGGIEFDIFTKLAKCGPTDNDIWKIRKQAAMSQLDQAHSISQMYSALGWLAGLDGDITGQQSNGFELWSPKDQWSSLRAGNL